MKRKVESSLKAWLDRDGRKPLVLMGARQVGKTWLMKDFGKRHFARCHVFNFDKEKDLAKLFRDTKKPGELLPKLSALSGFKINIDKDLVVFDEIQDCPEVLLRGLSQTCGHGRRKPPWRPPSQQKGRFIH